MRPITATLALLYKLSISCHIPVFKIIVTFALYIIEAPFNGPRAPLPAQFHIPAVILLYIVYISYIFNTAAWIDCLREARNGESMSPYTTYVPILVFIQFHTFDTLRK